MVHKLFLKIKSDVNGQGLIEYGMIVSIVAIALIGAMIIFREDLIIIYENINNNLP